MYGMPPSVRYVLSAGLNIANTAVTPDHGFHFHRCPQSTPGSLSMRYCNGAGCVEILLGACDLHISLKVK